MCSAVVCGFHQNGAFFFHIYEQKQKKLEWEILGQSCQWCRQHQLNLLIYLFFIF